MTAPNPPTEPEWSASSWKWENRRTYVPVRADRVLPGDLYANGATVTKSRRAKPEDVLGRLPSVNGTEVPLTDCWFVRTGQSMSTLVPRDKPIVVGRTSAPGGSA